MLAASAESSFELPSDVLVLPLSSALASSLGAPELESVEASDAPVPPEESSAADESSADEESEEEPESPSDEESSVEAESLDDESSALLDEEALLAALLDDELSSSFSILTRSGKV